MIFNAPLVISGDTDYAFASGVVRGKWSKRPGRTEFYRLIDAEPEELGKVLSEIGFAGAEENVEAALAGHWLETISLVESLSENPEITELLRLFTDFSNAAAAVKAEIFGFDYGSIHIEGGFASAEDLIKTASGETGHGSVPEDVRVAMAIAREAYSKSKLPLLIDVVSDHFFGKMYVGRMLSSGREFLAEYVRRWADIKNLTAYLRIRIAGLPIEDFKRFFIEGGHIDRAEYRTFEALELDGIPARLVFSPYGKPLADAVSRLVHENSFQPLSGLTNVILEDFLRQNIYISFGLEVVLAYAFLVWRELRAVGAIIRMRRAKIDREKIIERVYYGEL